MDPASLPLETNSSRIAEKHSTSFIIAHGLLWHVEIMTLIFSTAFCFCNGIQHETTKIDWGTQG